MQQITKVYIYNPSVKTGGTNNLLGNLAILLADKSKYEVNYIDYLNSPVATIIKNKTTKVNFIDYNPKIKLETGILIATLLDVKNIRNDFALNQKVQMLFWSTHPDDGLKILPSFNLWLRRKDSNARWAARLIHPFFKDRIKKFLDIGNESNGIVWMDKENYFKNKLFYNLTNEPNYLPIFTSEPINTEPAERFDKKNLRITILGRLTNFKIMPLYGLLIQISEFQKKHEIEIKLNFIGDGPFRSVLEKWLTSLGIVNYQFWGHIDLTELDIHLLNNHLLIGMGTSTLEGAKLKIPTLLMDGAYEPIESEYAKLRWLYEVEPYHVGRFVTNVGPIPEGRYFSEVMENLLNEKDVLEIGLKCFNHWKSYHSPDSALSLVESTIKKNTFYFNKKNKYFLRRDLQGYMIDFLKSKLK